MSDSPTMYEFPVWAKFKNPCEKMKADVVKLATNALLVIRSVSAYIRRAHNSPAAQLMAISKNTVIVPGSAPITEWHTGSKKVNSTRPRGRHKRCPNSQNGFSER